MRLVRQHLQAFINPRPPLRNLVRVTGHQIHFVGVTPSYEQCNDIGIYLRTKNYKAVNTYQKDFCIPVASYVLIKMREPNNLWCKLDMACLYRLFWKLDGLPLFYYVCLNKVVVHVVL